jgi:hypothetical protein
MAGIATRDLKQFLSAAVEVMRDPGLVERVLAACEKNERAAEEAQRELGELAIEREETRRRLARDREEQEEALRAARQAWVSEEALRRKRLEAAEAEVARKKETWIGMDARLTGRKASEEAA